MDNLYVIGTRVADGYPEGRYITMKVPGKVCDYYIVIGVLDYPSIRAVANPSAWSRAKVKKYGDVIIRKPDERTREPERYEYHAADTEAAYNESLLAAMDAERLRMIKRGDIEAALEMAKRTSLLKQELHYKGESI